MDKPDCYKCKYRCSIPGDCHSSCKNPYAKVKGNLHGIKNGWFFHPINFDPIWLVSCDGFCESKNEKYGKSILIKAIPACKMLIKLYGASNDK